MGFRGKAPSPSVSVVVGGRDFYLWPGFAGEDYPPTLSGSAAYGRNFGGPCMVASAGGGSSGETFWPAVGPLGPDPAKTVLVLQVDVYFNGGGAYPTWGFGLCAPGAAGAAGSMSVLFTGNTQAQVNGATVNFPFPYPGSPQGPGWRTLTLRSGGVMQLDGVTYRTAQTGNPPLMLPGTSALPNNTGLRLHHAGFTAPPVFRNVYASWERP